MQDIKYILESLEKIPSMLKNMIGEIPKELLKQRRIAGKWCIHEHACHIIAVQPMLIQRMEKFVKEEKPEFIPYFPDNTDKQDDFMNMDLVKQLDQFSGYRKELINKASHLSEQDFNKTSIHPEYKKYTPYILLRHILMHDLLHMYRIEELWLTNDSYLPE